MGKSYFLKSIIISLFLCLCLIPAAQSAEKPAGKIVRLTGSVEVVHHGKTVEGSIDLKIYPLDVITTGPESLVELIFLDGSSLHMGPDSCFELNQYIFDLDDNIPSFLAKMAKGLFVYISGAISKVHPGSVKFETPESTIGIRGTKLVVKIGSISKSESESGSSQKTTVILFRDNTGRVGTVTIDNQQGVETLNKEFYSVSVSLGHAPSKQVFVDRKTLEKMFPESLYEVIVENFAPPLPYTEDIIFLDDLIYLSVEAPEDQRPISVSSP